MPVTDKTAKGYIGEEIVARELIRRGYTVTERNYRAGHGEIDIIAYNDVYIIFMEVKTRSGGKYGSPAEAVTLQKQRTLTYAAQRYLHLHPSDLQKRFDVAEVFLTYDGELRGINIIEDAFYAQSTW